MNGALNSFERLDQIYSYDSSFARGIIKKVTTEDIRRSLILCESRIECSRYIFSSDPI